MKTIAMVSLDAPTGIGGVSAYERVIAAELSNLGIGGSFVCLEHRSGDTDKTMQELAWPVKKLDGKRWNKMRTLMMRLGSRPRFHVALEWLCSMALPANRLLRECEDSTAMHFVGTGWDFLGFAVAEASRRAGIPFSILPAVHPNQWGDDVIDIKLYNLADAVLCLSEYEAKHLIARGLKAEKVIRCALPPMCRSDGDGARLRARLGIGKRRCVLFLGRRDAGKGYPALLDAWPQVIQRIPEAVLLLAGPGDVDEKRVRTIQPQNFRDLGVPDEQGKADALAACDVFCLPSAHESYGIVYLEAWSYGKPVICGTAPASRELVKDGVNGLWADQNPSVLAEKLVALFGDEKMHDELGNADLCLQRRRYTTNEMIRVHLQAFGMN